MQFRHLTANANTTNDLNTGDRTILICSEFRSEFVELLVRVEGLLLPFLATGTLMKVLALGRPNMGSTYVEMVARSPAAFRATAFDLFCSDVSAFYATRE